MQTATVVVTGRADVVDAGEGGEAAVVDTATVDAHREPVRVLVALGSNLDEPVWQVEQALRALAALPQWRLLARAPLYRSAPWGPPGQPDYVNTAAVLETRRDPHQSLADLLALEQALGKVKPTLRFGARSIDLDLLTHGQATIDSDDLVLPHPRLHERAFVLYPLRDIAPDDWIPGRGRVRDLAASVDGSSTVPLEASPLS